MLFCDFNKINQTYEDQALMSNQSCAMISDVGVNNGSHFKVTSRMVEPNEWCNTMKSKSQFN